MGYTIAELCIMVCVKLKVLIDDIREFGEKQIAHFIRLSGGFKTWSCSSFSSETINVLEIKLTKKSYKYQLEKLLLLSTKWSLCDKGI